MQKIERLVGPLALASTPAQPKVKVAAHPINIGQPGSRCRPCRNSGSSIIIAQLPMAIFLFPGSRHMEDCARFFLSSVSYFFFF